MFEEEKKIDSLIVHLSFYAVETHFPQQISLHLTDSFLHVRHIILEYL